MKPELQAQLFALAPDWFDTKNPKKSLMCFGFECGDGWFGLLHKLILDLKEVAPKGFQVQQVKEKFGGLRFYVDKANETCYSLIDKAEYASFSICGDCGKTERPQINLGPQPINPGGWARTLCEPCKEAWDRKTRSEDEDGSEG